jgi:hypothetical protein
MHHVQMHAALKAPERLVDYTLLKEVQKELGVQ